MIATKSIAMILEIIAMPETSDFVCLTAGVFYTTESFHKDTDLAALNTPGSYGYNWAEKLLLEQSALELEFWLLDNQGENTARVRIEKKSNIPSALHHS